MRPGIFEEKSNNHLKEVTVKIRERYRASTYAQLEETASGDSNRVNPSWKQNLFMTGLLWAVGAATGMLLQLLPL